MIAKGSNAVKNHGVEYEIVKITLMMPNRQPAKESVVWGISVSITFISLENLFVSLPIGVVSKKDIGQCSIFTNRLLCSHFDAIQAPNVIIIALKYVHMQWPIPNKPYTSRYLSRSAVEIDVSELHLASHIRAPTRKNLEPRPKRRKNIVIGMPTDFAYVRKTVDFTCNEIKRC